MLLPPTRYSYLLIPPWARICHTLFVTVMRATGQSALGVLVLRIPTAAAGHPVAQRRGDGAADRARAKAARGGGGGGGCTERCSP